MKNLSPSTPLSLLQKVVPLNLEEEKEKFFFDANYNPQFEYAEEIYTQEFTRYGDADERYLPQAKWILDAVIKKYGNESSYLQTVEGNVLSEAEVQTIITTYLQRHDLEDRINISYSRQHLARTAVEKTNENFLLKVRLPLEYRKNGIQGVLNHEIGTHVFRWINEMKQPWHQVRSRFQLSPFVETEEGLASLHAAFTSEAPYLWSSALYYYLVGRAAQSSFVQLNTELKKYIDDKERRWKFCVRVKRGIRDTSLPGAFTKDQVYFLGAIQVLNWLCDHEFDVGSLYWGKLSLNDVEKVRQFARSDELQLPQFALDKKQYAKRIEEIAHWNNLKSV